MVNTMWLKTTKSFLVITLSIFVVSCDNNVGGSPNNISTSAVNLQSTLDKAVYSKDAIDLHITGIPLTFQCDGVNNNQPVALSTGRISDQITLQKLPTDAIFEIGSISKSFVSVVTLQLADEINPNTGTKYFGDKGLDSTVGEILGNPSTSDTWNADWNTVTLRQLLNMTSGISDYNNIIASAYFNNPYNKDDQFTTDYLLAAVAKQPFLFKPGHGWGYANTNYVIMNKIISSISGISIKEQITKRIITPLKLTHTYYTDNIPVDAISNIQQKSLLMSGYSYQGSWIDVTPYSMAWGNAAGSMLSSTSDINVYVRALFASSDKGGLLTQARLDELTSVVAQRGNGQYKAGDPIIKLDKNASQGFGLGVGAQFIELSDHRSSIFYYYSGLTLGFTSEWTYQKDRNASAVYTVNTGREVEAKWGLMGSLDNNVQNKIFNECNIVN